MVDFEVHLGVDGGTRQIGLARSTCCIDLLEASAGYFALPLAEARGILKGVARATAAWREVARTVGATPKEIDRLATAFEHDDLQQALALG